MVVVRDRVVAGLLFLRGCSTAGHHTLELVLEVICCCVVGRRVGVGRAEGLLLMCFGKCVSCACRS